MIRFEKLERYLGSNFHFFGCCLGQFIYQSTNRISMRNRYEVDSDMFLSDLFKPAHHPVQYHPWRLDAIFLRGITQIICGQFGERLSLKLSTSVSVILGSTSIVDRTMEEMISALWRVRSIGEP